MLIDILLLLFFFLRAQTDNDKEDQILISVNVTGFVATPGTYQMPVVSRISDAIKLAGEASRASTTTQTLPQQRIIEAERDSLYRNYQGLRSVQLTRGKETRTYDLLRFTRTGDLGQNPILRDGDEVRVTPVDASLTISGEVYFPGVYEYVKGDRLSDILELAQGFTLAADRGMVNIYRLRDDSGDFEIMHLDLRKSPAEQIVLRPYDRISVPGNTELTRVWKIRVEGDVKAPGEYYIGEKTTLYDVLLLCGGPTSRGNLRNAIYANQSGAQNTDSEFERLLKTNVSSMTSMEYHYVLNRIRQYPGRYSIDVSRTWESKGAEANPVLRDGDYLFVPQNLDMVEVSGQVVNPGLIPWVEGQNYEYYVQQAGGYTNNKRWRGTRVISAASGNWVKPDKKLLLNPGDTVFVAEKDTYDVWSRFKDIMLVATQVITIFLGVRTLTN